MGKDGRALRDGAVAGLVATATMSTVMLAARRLGLMGEPPPQRIADAALEAVGQRRSPAWLRKGLAVTGHFGFGAALGTACALAHRRYPAPLAPIPRGLIVGSIVWFGSYQGWVPALGIMPPARRDRPGRPATMLAAHWVYGATLALCLGRGGRRDTLG